MFDRPTVIIVGAGASCEFDFPDGKALMTSIQNRLGNLRSSPTTHVVARMHDSIGRLFSGNWSAALEAADSLRRGLDHAYSIDNLLSEHIGDVRRVNLGKLLIMFEIANAERASSLMRQEDLERAIRTRSFQNVDKVKASWLHRLFHLISMGRNGSSLESIFDNLTIVNFNYDRTIQHYLSHAMAEYFPDISLDAARRLVRRLRIYHAYGSIGSLPWDKDDDSTMAVDFGGDIGIGHSPSLPIFTFTEDAPLRGETRALLHLRLRDAFRLIFVGFAFHDQNMRLLFEGGLGTPTVEQIYATTYGMPAPRYSSAQQKFHKMLIRTGLSPQMYDGKASALFDHFGTHLSG